MVDFQTVAAYEGDVVSVHLVGTVDPIRATVTMSGLDHVIVDAPFAGYRRERMPLSDLLSLEP
jgi:hypothetical protein